MRYAVWICGAGKNIGVAAVDKVADFNGVTVIEADSVQLAVEIFEQSSERKIRRYVLDLESRLFGDMTLRAYKFLYDATIERGNQYLQFYDNGVRKIPDITIRDWRFLIDDDMEFEGICLDKEKTIKLKSKFKNDEIVLCHELIHAYESMLPERYRQFLTVFLFNRLQSNIPSLIDKITLDSHVALSSHSPLFFLKSLDLDLRLNKPLGTFYAYDRDKILF